MKGYVREESGFAITTLLLLVSVATAVIVGGSSTVAAVQNRADIVEASDRMYQVSQDINERTADDDSPRAQALRDYAEQMRSASVAMNASANKDVYTNVRNNVGDAVLTPLQGGAVITAAKFAWDVKTGWELGDTAMKSWGITDPGADEVLGELKGMGIDRDYDAPIEQAIVEAKLRGAKTAVAQTDPGIGPDEVAAIAARLVIDVETNGSVASAGDPYHNGFLAQVMAGIGFNVPDGAAVGDVAGGDDGYDDGDDGYYDDGSANGSAGAVPEGLTSCTWELEAVVWECEGFVDPRDAPSQPYQSENLGGLGNQRLQFWFKDDGTISHRHVFYGSGTYTYNDGIGDIAYDDEVGSGTVKGATFYYDAEADVLYVVERYVESYTGELTDRAFKMKRGY